MRRGILALALLALAGPLFAAGSIAVTSSFDTAQNVVRYDIAWTSDAAGAVSGNTLAIRRGRVIQYAIKPGAGGTQPTDLYDLVLNTVDGVDILDGKGANNSNTTAELGVFWPPIYYDATTALDLVVSNAGNAKTGTFTVWIANP